MQSTPATLKYHLPSQYEVDLYELLISKVSDKVFIMHPYFQKGGYDLLLIHIFKGADAGLPTPTPFAVRAISFDSNVS